EVLRLRLLQAAVRVPELAKSCHDHNVPPDALVGLAADWISGMPLGQLRNAHAAALGEPDPMSFSATLERVVVRDLPWILSAAIEFVRLRRGEDWSPFVELSALPAMAKFG